MLWMSAIKPNKRRFPEPPREILFGEFCLNQPQERILLCFIGFTRCSLWILVHGIKAAQEMP
jgi:hypothetical protein